MPSAAADNAAQIEEAVRKFQLVGDEARAYRALKKDPRDRSDQDVGHVLVCI